VELWLLNALVVKHFGAFPNKGRCIKGHTIRSACGIKYKQAWGNGKFVPHEITVDMVISLQWIRGNNQEGLWKVTATKGYEDIALEWLMDHCQIKSDKPTKRRKVQGRAKIAKWGRLPMKVDNG
jgi:hypothetical protein